jgi:hypothetical protein
MLPWSVACDANWLREEQSTLTTWEKSAAGIVGEGETSPDGCREDSPH